MPLIHINQVSKFFHKGDEKITPLDNAELLIDRGEFVSLMGASGTGKSTLLNLIAGIDRPTSGQIIVDNVDITGMSRTKLATWRARNIGYVFQTHNLIPVLTAYENIELPLLLLPMNRSERQRPRRTGADGCRSLKPGQSLSSPTIRRSGTAGGYRAGDCDRPYRRRRGRTDRRS